MPIHFPGSVLADLAVAIADGADSISDLKTLRDEAGPFGSVASTPTAWRVLDRVSAAHLLCLRAGRAAARAAAWKAGASPDLSAELYLDLDATIVIAHSDKELAAPTWKHTYGFHPLACFLDRPEIASGEALAGLLREGRAGSNTTADHICVLDMALANLPEHARGMRRARATSLAPMRRAPPTALRGSVENGESASAPDFRSPKTSGRRSWRSEMTPGATPSSPRTAPRSERGPGSPRSATRSTCRPGPRDHG